MRTLFATVCVRRSTDSDCGRTETIVMFGAMRSCLICLLVAGCQPTTRSSGAQEQSAPQPSTGLSGHADTGDAAVATGSGDESGSIDGVVPTTDAAVIADLTSPADLISPAGLMPLYCRDVTSASRTEMSTDSGHTEYFNIDTSTGTWGTSVYLISGDNSITYDYVGITSSGYLMVAHTFDTVILNPYTVSIDYLDLANAPKHLTLYFPAFSTSNGRKMYFYIANDGSSYYADPQNDGIDDEATEMLSVTAALVPAHLAWQAP